MRLFLAAGLVFLLSQPAMPQQGYADWYPSSIPPPSGHQYPCALTALPKNLAGIPAGDRQFINHAYSLILKCLQAKLVMIDTLRQGGQSCSSAYARYYADTAAARQKLLSEPVPSGLEPFRNDVVNAIDQQMVFFKNAVAMSQSGRSFAELLQIPEGRAASNFLFAAFGKMSSRYSSWSPEVKDSIYHHLCALDVF